MLIQSTIDGLNSLKLFGMIKSLESQMDNPDSNSLCFEERLGLLVDNELTTRENKRLQSRLRLAKLAEPASIEELDFKGNRGVDRAALVSLTTSDWIRRHQNIIIDGKTGVGKSYLACALAQKACRDGFSVHFERASRLFQELAIARADGRYSKLIAAIARKDLLIIDDFALFALNAEQRQDLLEIVEDRYSTRSTIITTQIDVEHWHQIIGDPTIADAILDRVVHNCHKLHLKGGSRRKDEAKAMELVG
jgi:DNA replication protein DnaC